jgi:transposase InsO family protein
LQHSESTGHFQLASPLIRRRVGTADWAAEIHQLHHRTALLGAVVGLPRVLAQVDATFSNSMIEAFWRSVKHSWLYLHTLDSFTALGRLIEFYVTAHNEVMPHAAFNG